MSGIVDVSADARSKILGGNLRVRAFVKFASNGTNNRSQGFSTISKPGTGSYQCNFTVTAPTTDYIVVATAETAGGYNVIVHDKQTGYFKIGVTYENAGAYNSACSVIVLY